MSIPDNKKRIAITLEKEDLAKLEEMAKADDRTLSKWIIQQIRRQYATLQQK